MIKFSDVTKAYQTDEPVLAHCSLSVPEGSVYALVGKNRAGKSTLLKLAAGFLCPDYGEICFQDMPVWENREFHMNDYQGAGKELFEKEVLAEMKGDVL